MDSFSVAVLLPISDLVVVMFGKDWLLLCRVMLPSSSSIVFFELRHEVSLRSKFFAELNVYYDGVNFRVETK